jgi:flagellar hook-associated protein 2
MTISPAFRASGIASGLDTTSLINSLVELESAPIGIATKQQTAYKSQLSSLGDIISKLSALKTAATGLSTSGALGMSATTTASTFTASASSSSTSGRYSVSVDFLAQAARARSASFASSTAAVTGGTLDFSIDGTTTSVTIDDGMTLTALADRINKSGAAVSATVLDTGGQTFLSITRRDTGFVPGQPASSALQITETSTGSAGHALGASIVQAAENAKVKIGRAHV